jgi:hypothetical protein
MVKKILKEKKKAMVKAMEILKEIAMQSLNQKRYKNIN